jgi:hypothetical protein
LGLEGIVSKRTASRYVSGRTRAWLKTKNPNFPAQLVARIISNAELDWLIADLGKKSWRPAAHIAQADASRRWPRDVLTLRVLDMLHVQIERIKTGVLF